MDDLAYIQNYFKGSMAAKDELFNSQEIVAGVVEASNLIYDCFENGGKVLLAGNGGSAADCQHIAAEFVSRFFYDRPGLPAIALTTDTSILTAWSNDFSYDSVFERQIEAFNSQIGLAIGLSTSGKSKSVLMALKKANILGISTCLISGIKERKLDYIDFSIEIPSKETDIIQTITQIIYHSICQELE